MTEEMQVTAADRARASQVLAAYEAFKKQKDDLPGLLVDRIERWAKKVEGVLESEGVLEKNVHPQQVKTLAALQEEIVEINLAMQEGWPDFKGYVGCSLSANEGKEVKSLFEIVMNGEALPDNLLFKSIEKVLGAELLEKLNKCQNADDKDKALDIVISTRVRKDSKNIHQNIDPSSDSRKYIDYVTLSQAYEKGIEEVLENRRLVKNFFEAGGSVDAELVKQLNTTIMQHKLRDIFNKDPLVLDEQSFIRAILQENPQDFKEPTTQVFDGIVRAICKANEAAVHELRWQSEDRARFPDLYLPPYPIKIASILRETDKVKQWVDTGELMQELGTKRRMIDLQAGTVKSFSDLSDVLQDEINRIIALDDPDSRGAQSCYFLHRLTSGYSNEYAKELASKRQQSATLAVQVTQQLGRER